MAISCIKTPKYPEQSKSVNYTHTIHYDDQLMILQALGYSMFFW